MRKLLFYWLTKNSGTYINRHYGPTNRYGKKRRSSFGKLKVMLAVAGVMVLVLGGLAVGGAIYVATQLVSGVGEQLSTENVEEARTKLNAVGQQLSTANVEEARSKIAAVASRPLVSQSCLSTIAGLLDPTRWLTQPIQANLQSVHASCVGSAGGEAKSQQPRES